MCVFVCVCVCVCVCVQDSPLFPVFLRHGPCDWNMLPRMGVRVDRIVWDPAHNRGYCTNLCTRKSTVDRSHTFWNDDLRDGAVLRHAGGRRPRHH